MLLCGSEKGGTSHVPRLRQVLERALRLLLWQRRSFLGSFKSDVVQMYPLLQATRVVGVFFSDAWSLGLNRSSRASWWGNHDSRATIWRSLLQSGHFIPQGLHRVLPLCEGHGARVRLKAASISGTWPPLRGCALLLKSPVNFFLSRESWVCCLERIEVFFSCERIDFLEIWSSFSRERIGRV